MASMLDPSAGDAAPHVCLHCSKVFTRLCDLNKHAKAHSRPYKCNVANCKYTTLGWPTAKELERHNNDKHSVSPRTFACLFTPCPYRSKRESNCKQHMEKAHNWDYVRSKSKGKRSPAQLKADDDWNYSPKECGLTLEADHSSSIASTSPPPFLAPPPGMDFVLFDDDQDAIGEDDDHLYTAYGGAQGLESYLPWTSPMTRLRKNETFIEMFTQTYNGALDKTSTANDTNDVDVDPMLSDETLHHIQNHERASTRALFASDVVIKVESPIMMADAYLPKKRKYEPIEASANPKLATFMASGDQSFSNRTAGAGQALSTPAKPWAPSRDGDGPDEGNRRPRKKSKPNSAEDFTDTSMPDIFRHAHPDIYDRSQHEKYSPCHTVHRDISTLVRHLGRPAHRLKVTERTISSFDIEDSDFNHPKVGLCRWCWQTFGDRPTFDSHTSRPCQKVSKGKREKWRALFDCFTPIVYSTNAARPSIDSTEHAEEERCGDLFGNLNESTIFNDEGHDRDETGTPPTSFPSPTLSDAATSVPSRPEDGRFISTDEYRKLEKEHQALREKHQQLERVTQVLLARQILQETMRQTPPTKSAIKLPPAIDTSKNSSPPSNTAESSPLDDLVQHMDSQSTDVNVQGLMEEMESTRRSLSRMNSGLSTASRSTIHHVPPSPPPRAAALPVQRNPGPAHQQAKQSLTHRPPPPSIPDSGYGTEQRRGSLGDVLMGNNLITPPSSLDRPEDAKTPTQQESFPWGDSPSARTPRATTPTPSSQPNSQQPHHGFFADQEMPDYDEDSYSLFFPDNHHENSPRLDFPTFDFPLQID